MGKGIEWYFIAELIILKSADTVPMALPLAILISSTMTMGSIAEHYELAALKSSGLSLIRVMRPLIILVICISGFSLYFTNVVSPTATIKFKQILYDIVHKKPMMELKDNVFYNDLKGFTIRVGNKNEKTGELTDVLIYDHRDNSKGNKSVIRAKKGQTKRSGSGNFMLLELYDGVSYEEREPNNKKGRNHPHLKSTFEKSVLTLDLSSLDFQETDEDRFNSLMSILNMSELAQMRDSMTTIIGQKNEELAAILHTSYLINSDTSNINLNGLSAISNNYDDLQLADKSRILSLAKSSVDNMVAHIKSRKSEHTYLFKKRNNAQIVYFEKVGFAISCLIMFFIGAPLGAIIKKGGLGLPMIFSILFFLLYHILNMIGRKMAKSYDLEPYQGLLLASTILLPIGVFLTTKAANDSSLFDMDAYKKFFNKLIGKKETKHENPSVV